MKVNFYLKNVKAKKTSAIYLDFSYDGLRLQTSVGLSLMPSQWNKKNSYPKCQIENYDVFREYLERVKNIVERFYLETKNKGQVPHPTCIKKHLDSQLNQKQDNGDGKIDFLTRYEEYIECKSLLNYKGTMFILRNSLKELIQFSSLYKIGLEFENKS